MRTATDLGSSLPNGLALTVLCQSAAVRTMISICLPKRASSAASNCVSSPAIVVIGAVHISQALAPMARIAGYDLEVIDPRTAFATQDTWTTFLVGSAASVGAGISMGFTEAAHDDGVLSGRGSPWKRGLASGVMTTVGGLGHALPYLIPDFWTATTIAMIVVFIELWAIAWIQNRYMETPFLRAALQVVVGGALVFAAGALIGGG